MLYQELYPAAQLTRKDAAIKTWAQQIHAHFAGWSSKKLEYSMIFVMSFKSIF